MTGNIDTVHSRTADKNTSPRHKDLSEAADDFQDMGFDVNVDPNDETKFTVDLSGAKMSAAMLGGVLRDKCANRNLEYSRQGAQATISL